MRLYVANCTKTNAVLSYRLLEVKNGLAQPCEAGQQILVAKPDLSRPQIDHFLEQMRPFGMYVTDELGGIDKGALIYWLAQMEKPMKMDKIQRALAHNEAALFAQGKGFRQAAAIAANNRINQYSPHAAGTMEITIQEESEGNSSPTGEPLVAEGYRIDRGA